MEARAAECERFVARAYEGGSALNGASMVGIDDVRAPAETRRGPRAVQRGALGMDPSLRSPAGEATPLLAGRRFESRYSREHRRARNITEARDDQITREWQAMAQFQPAAADSRIRESA